MIPVMMIEWFISVVLNGSLLFDKTMNLNDLPDDILLYIVQYDFMFNDAIAFRLTCKRLYSLSYSRSFWLRIAATLEKVHPLPLPPFKTVAALTDLELQSVCKRHAFLRCNIESDNPHLPLPRESRVLRLRGHSSEIYHFAFLPGGKYIMVLHIDGVFACWDTSAVQPCLADEDEDIMADINMEWAGQNDRHNTNDIADNEIDDGIEFRIKSSVEPLVSVGKLVARFETWRRPISWNFQTFPDKSDVNVAILSVHDPLANDFGVPTHIKVLRLNFDDPICVSVRLVGEVLVRFPVARLFIQDDMLCITGVYATCLTILLWNWRTGQKVAFNTGLSEEPWKYDSLPLHDSGLLLYHERGEGGVAQLYDNLPRLMAEVSIQQQAAVSGSEICVREPDFTIEVAFEGASAASGLRKWFTTHPWNTPNRALKRPVSILVTAHGTEEPLSSRILGHHWLDVEGLVRYMRENRHKGKPVVLQRSLYRIHDRLREGFIGSELVCPGSDGTHIVWFVDRYAAAGRGEFSPGIYLAVVGPMKGFPAGAKETNPALRVKALNTGGRFDTKTVCSLDIDDSMGIFGFATYIHGAGHQEIHLVYY